MNTLRRGIAMLVVVAFMLPTTGFAKQVTVNNNDLPFDIAKQILLSGDKNLQGLADDALRTILQNRGLLTFDDSVLSEGLRSKLQASQKIAEVTEQLKVGRDWAEMGRAIGIATREGLSAVTTETAKFADTTPGRFTMVMIAWKVMGADFLASVKGYLIGVPLLIFWCSLFVWWLRRVYGIHKVTRLVDGKKVVEEMPPLSVQWAEAWAKNPGAKDNTSDMVVFAALKTVGFVVGIFVIVWIVI